MTLVFTWFKYPPFSTSSLLCTLHAGPRSHLCFDKIPPVRDRVSHRPPKRRRPLWDVDGGLERGKKKRRLRLNLVTSRLSRPYSAPATNIISRGGSKIAIWAKSRHLDKNVLRKAAIMNRVRTGPGAAHTMVCYNHGEFRQTIALGELIAQRPKSQLPPSPLGLSNYDALDLEDEMMDGGDSCGSNIYSDFNVMNPTTECDGESYAYLDELDGIPHDLPEERTPAPPNEHIAEILEEKERQREISFIKFEA
ncbi:MAG: hypothetical protein M1818_007287 [Claussenomyces sp. TS43310]|nr:MAG: hypothetical protein M1818_007287 [Claussenomyces sp. TS43310]